MLANTYFLDFSGWLINWRYVAKVSLSFSVSLTHTYRNRCNCTMCNALIPKIYFESMWGREEIRSLKQLCFFLASHGSCSSLEQWPPTFLALRTRGSDGGGNDFTWCTTCANAASQAHPMLLQPGFQWATDQYWATDQRLGTPALEGFRPVPYL